MRNSIHPIISHLYFEEDSKQWVVQTNEDHCNGVANKASQFANTIGLKNWGKILGHLHDRGKEKNDFQRYIKTKSGYDPDAGPYEDKAHSIIGAILIQKKYKDPLKVLSNIIAGHHRGLYDTDSLDLLLKNSVPEEVSKIIPEITLERPSHKLQPKDISHLTRVLFSCLTDADYLDTEKFMNPKDHAERGNYSSLNELKSKLDRWLSRFDNVQQSPLNIIRKEIQEACFIKSSDKSGFFELTVPTGGGKTISSMVWAINHAIKHNKERVIIAIPYTSIIIQTANILREIFGEDNVLEHHSVVSEENMTYKNKLMSENWDVPIVVTTNVQLFESMFSNRPGKCRKLHSLCNSVLILDEVQNLPLSFQQPIVDALDTYVRAFDMSVLFCTASQPCLAGDKKGLGSTVYNGIKTEVKSIISPDACLHEKLKRVQIQMPSSKETLEEVATRIALFTRVLCIVNTRRLASELYNLMPLDGILIHLSRMMCPKHIQDKLSYIQTILSTTEDIPIRVISTQLIEAGVDIDFPTVFRQFSGLDSIIQAAGRCNREGNQKISTAYVFDLNGHIARGSLGIASDAMRQLLSIYPDSDWLSPDTMSEYFRILYSKTSSFDKENIKDKTSNPKNIYFEDVSAKFKLIDDNEINVIVNYGEASKWINKLKKNGPSKFLIKQLGLYSVGIRKKLFLEFYKSGIIDEVWDGIYYIPLSEQYDENLGLKVNNEYIEQTFVI